MGCCVASNGVWGNRLGVVEGWRAAWRVELDDGAGLGWPCTHGREGLPDAQLGLYWVQTMAGLVLC